MVVTTGELAGGGYVGSADHRVATYEAEVTTVEVVRLRA